jgi:hypothetical protein
MFASQSQSHYGRRSVGQLVLVSSPIWGPRPDFCYCQTFAVLSMWGALSDERTDLLFVAIYSAVHDIYIYKFICQESGSLWIHIIYSFMCNCSIYCRAYVATIYKTGIGLTTGFIGSHTVTVYALL